MGPEIAIKALNNHIELRNRTIIYGSADVIRYYLKSLKLTLPLNVISDHRDFQAGQLNVRDIVALKPEDYGIGQVSAIAGDAAYQYIAAAIKDAQQHEIEAVVTAPLNKEALHLGGHNFDGHTEIFATLTGTEKYSMMLWSSYFSVVHVSTHVALREACNRVTQARVEECIELAQHAMTAMGIEQPKIAVAGLNPHSSEHGLFGNEEAQAIIPAVTAKQAAGFDVTGPVPPDTVFLKASQGVYDIVVAMYHDQGHIPMKLLAFDSGVNVTLGLPIIRTSVDHGTAFDIADQGIAKETSMVAALELAVKYAENQA